MTMYALFSHLAGIRNVYLTSYRQYELLLGTSPIKNGELSFRRQQRTDTPTPMSMTHWPSKWTNRLLSKFHSAMESTTNSTRELSWQNTNFFLHSLGYVNGNISSDRSVSSHNWPHCRPVADSSTIWLRNLAFRFSRPPVLRSNPAPVYHRNLRGSHIHQQSLLATTVEPSSHDESANRLIGFSRNRFGFVSSVVPRRDFSELRDAMEAARHRSTKHRPDLNVVFDSEVVGNHSVWVKLRLTKFMRAWL